MKTKLSGSEQEIEGQITDFTPISSSKMKTIDEIIDKTNKKKSISLRLQSNDLEKLKQIASSEGMPYQTLLASIVHKFVSDQLVDKKSILQSIAILKAT